MSTPTRTYKKNSFIDIRQHKTLEDIFPRIRNLKDSLHTISLSDYKKSIIQSACTELLNTETLDNKSNPFKLHSHNLNEINQLEDENLPESFRSIN